MDQTHILASSPCDWSKTRSEDAFYAHFGVDHFAGLRRAARAVAWAFGRRGLPAGPAPRPTAVQTVL